MSIDRRLFGAQVLGTVGEAAAIAALGGAAAIAQTASDHPSTGNDARPASAPSSRRGNPIGISTYSFWRFLDDSKLSIEQCIDEAARMGFDAVEILQMQMT